MGALTDARRFEPRVVILDRERGPEVGVVEIPAPASVGAEFEHEGRSWRVFGCRQRTRVLLAAECSRLSHREHRC